MNIILVSNRMSKAITLGPAHLLLLAALCLLTLLGSLTAASWLTYQLTKPLGLNLPRFAALPLSNAAQQQQIDALAVRLGEMQAQMLRLDSLTQRVSDKTGIDVSPFKTEAAAPQGGAPSSMSRQMDYFGLSQSLSHTEQRLAAIMEQYQLIETVLTQRKLARWQAPTNLPMSAGMRTSTFGWRIDPFDGSRAFHEGIDFEGDVGTPIQAAAEGRVLTSGYHSGYGNQVVLDHGKGMTSRYAHASKLLVKEGERVSSGQVIALLGSTGRSTGPHLHFEIRYKDVPQNPVYFLADKALAKQ